MGSEKSGQIFSADFLIGVIVVLFIMTSLQVYHSRVLEDIREEKRMVFQESLNSRADTLLLYQGKPENWNSENVNILGFSTGVPNELNRTKLVEYFSMDKSKAEDLFPLQEHDFRIVIEDKDGNVISGDGVDFEMGTDDWKDSKNVYVTERGASIYGRNGRVSLRLIVW